MSIQNILLINTSWIVTSIRSSFFHNSLFCYTGSNGRSKSLNHSSCNCHLCILKLSSIQAFLHSTLPHSTCNRNSRPVRCCIKYKILVIVCKCKHALALPISLNFRKPESGIGDSGIRILCFFINQ